MLDPEMPPHEIRARLIRSGGILPSAQNANPEKKPSLWLYCASLIATVSALYVMNFSVDQESFSTLTYGVALTGYALSYYLRVQRLSLKTVQTPLVICLGLILFAVASSDNGLKIFVPEDLSTDRQRLPHFFFLWLTLLQTFTLTSDAALLFLCVPCMTLIALVSTGIMETPVYLAFIVFVGALTFLMIHENYLRSQTEKVLGRSPLQEKRLFQGQAGLAALCLIGALGAAQVVSIPLRWFGQIVSSSANFTNLSSQLQQNVQKVTSGTIIGEQDKVEIATGPVTASEIVLMEVQSPIDAYWRGTTFDFYTGRSFTHAKAGSLTGPLTPSRAEAASVGHFQEGGVLQKFSSRQINEFTIPLRPVELLPDAMKGGRQIEQTYKVLAGNFTQLYAAGNPEKVNAAISGLSPGVGGGLGLPEPLPVNSEYRVTSRIADDAPETLRAASKENTPLPFAISEAYLQIGNRFPELEEYVRQETAGLTTSYDKVIALKTAIARDCKYSLQAPKAPPESDVVLNFLTKSKVGYCDSFGSALTVLCRYANIPARLASGFITGKRLENGTVQVREKDKHIWTEVFFPQVGWVTFDATEGAQDISDYSDSKPENTRGFIPWLKSRSLLSIGAFGVILVLGGVLFYNEILPRLKQKSGAAAVQPRLQNLQMVTSYQKLVKVLEKRGIPREASLTNDEYAEKVWQHFAETLPEFPERFSRLTEQINRFRYGNHPAEEAVTLSVQSEMASLKALLHEKRSKARTLEAETKVKPEGAAV